MTELERLAAAVLAQWRTEGHQAAEPITVGDLLDRVFPYRNARRLLGIDISEDYEALVLRLLSEEESLVRVDPLNAAQMAKATITSRLPDLDVLQLLRAATFVFTSRSIARLEDVLPIRPGDSDASAADVGGGDTAVIPLYPEPADEEPEPGAIAPPESFLTSVAFTSPVDDRCWSCGDLLPLGRTAKFCPHCGADQRQPVCPGCGTRAEHGWKHCPDCGTRLARG